jgi:hypothetical protein
MRIMGVSPPPGMITSLNRPQAREGVRAVVIGFALLVLALAIVLLALYWLGTHSDSNVVDTAPEDLNSARSLLAFDLGSPKGSVLWRRRMERRKLDRYYQSARGEIVVSPFSSTIRLPDKADAHATTHSEFSVDGTGMVVWKLAGDGNWNAIEHTHVGLLLWNETEVLIAGAPRGKKKRAVDAFGIDFQLHRHSNSSTSSSSGEAPGATEVSDGVWVSRNNAQIVALMANARGEFGDGKSTGAGVAFFEGSKIPQPVRLRSRADTRQLEILDVQNNGQARVAFDLNNDLLTTHEHWCYADTPSVRFVGLLA